MKIILEMMKIFLPKNEEQNEKRKKRMKKREKEKE
jgi:hypothetical protein